LEEERRAREFKARPIPSSRAGQGLEAPALPPKPPTRPVPFDLAIERRVEERLDKWQRSVEDDLRKQREAASSFKAQDPKVLRK